MTSGKRQRMVIIGIITMIIGLIAVIAGILIFMKSGTALSAQSHISPLLSEFWFSPM